MMRKMALILALALAVGACAPEGGEATTTVGAPETTPTTPVESVTTLPSETTVPTETTEPSDTTTP